MENEATDEIQFWRNKAHEYERVAQEKEKLVNKYLTLYSTNLEEYKKVILACRKFNDEIKDNL